MSSLTTMARPYAKAAFELALGDNKLAGWEDMLGAVTQVTADKAMIAWLKSPHATAGKAVDIIIEALGGEVDARFQAYLGVLADNDRLLLCGEITR
ncbi:MAG: F0F1 ATP synthase subunit delta, partial [Xanthomonadales bacterium]|nr:F0F1 ATP synthase subunit delta [Xanthomonadales bacterium]